ncbi:MAG TPA: shikimate dehydrogenase, partial [Microbacteriaceae bacterium]|nr:shikimate dehydrogenase [Microbacteriaceae bacterium]
MPRYGVLGSPISHSKSPVLHRAAYTALGLDWSYEAVELDRDRFDAWIASDGRQFAGCSVTMPLKHDLALRAGMRDAATELTGVANTVVGLDSGVLTVANTDVAGIVESLRPVVSQPRSARILGAGATALSSLVALSELGVTEVQLDVRTPERAVEACALAERLELTVAVERLCRERLETPVDILVSTVPAGALGEVARVYGDSAAVVLDVAYAPWPSELVSAGSAWTVVSGLEMLLHQATRQIRLFHNGSVDEALPDEGAVVAAMREAL